MKKLLFVASLGVAGLMSAKGTEVKTISESKNQKSEKIADFIRYRLTIKTVCGTTYQTIFDTDFDTYECLYNEWEMYNNEDCGHSSFENPMV